MDQKEEIFEKIPFYMTYPIQNLYQAEQEYEKDLERIKETYPEEIRKIMPFIEKHCDQLEYEGSRIYDENPDRTMMENEKDKLYEIIREMVEETGEEKMDEDVEQWESPVESEQEPIAELVQFSLLPPDGMPLPGGFGYGRRPGAKWQGFHGRSGGRRCCDGWLKSLVGVLFDNEIYRRRCRYRRCRRWW